jgi:hypothetical protein
MTILNAKTRADESLTNRSKSAAKSTQASISPTFRHGLQFTVLKASAVSFSVGRLHLLVTVSRVLANMASMSTSSTCMATSCRSQTTRPWYIWLPQRQLNSWPISLSAHSRLSKSECSRHCRHMRVL